MEEYIKKKFPKRLRIARLVQESKGNYDRTFLDKTGEYLEQISEEWEKVRLERHIEERSVRYYYFIGFKFHLLDLVCILGPDFNDELLEESKRILNTKDIQECVDALNVLLNKYGVNEKIDKESRL